MLNNKIISIQSKLIYGYVGSNIAELAIQQQGLDVIAFPTVILSAHSGHQPMYGQATPQALFEELIKGIKAINIIESVACIVSGYIKTEEIVNSSFNFIREIKTEYPTKTYICDPVMGDVDTGIYVPKETADEIISKLIPLADIITPNHFEIEYILRQKIQTIESLAGLIKENPLLSVKSVIVTSCELEDSEKGFIDTVLIESGSIHRFKSPKIEGYTVGTGDLFSSTLSAQIALGIEIKEAIGNSTRYISSVLEYMSRKGYDEMNAECLLSSRLLL